jgi:hypothetical protein
LSRVNRAAIIEGVKALQQEDGRLAVIVWEIWISGIFFVEVGINVIEIYK